jgi:hypothetical protein
LRRRSNSLVEGGDQPLPAVMLIPRHKEVTTQEAAAIHRGAQAIVTYSPVDFPDSELNKHNFDNDDLGWTEPSLKNDQNTGILGT